MIRRLVLTAALLAATPALAEPDYAAAIRADYDASLGALFDWFHRNPELSFKEVNTAARMAKELRAIPGIVVTEKVGGTVEQGGADPEEGGEHRIPSGRCSDYRRVRLPLRRN